MRGLVVPEKTEDYTADPVELFFDLAFVFAFSQIVHMLVVHPDWEHIGKAGRAQRNTMPCFETFDRTWWRWWCSSSAASSRTSCVSAPGVLRCRRAVILGAGSIDAVWLIVLIDVIGLAGLAAEQYRVEKRPGDSGIDHAHD